MKETKQLRNLMEVFGDTPDEENLRLDGIIHDNDYYDTAYGMGLEFITRDVNKRYPVIADRIINRVSELIRKNSQR